MSCNTITLKNGARSLLYDELNKIYTKNNSSDKTVPAVLYSITKSNSFRYKFLDSKVVDKNNEPKILYISNDNYNNNNYLVENIKLSIKDIDNYIPVFVYDTNNIEKNKVVSKDNILTINDIIKNDKNTKDIFSYSKELLGQSNRIKNKEYDDFAVLGKQANMQNELEAENINKKLDKISSTIKVEGIRLVNKKVEIDNVNTISNIKIDFTNYTLSNKLVNIKGSIINDIVKEILRVTGNSKMYEDLVQIVLNSKNEVFKQFLDSYDVGNKQQALEELISAIISTTVTLQRSNKYNIKLDNYNELKELLGEDGVKFGRFTQALYNELVDRDYVSNFNTFTNFIRAFGNYTDLLTIKDITSEDAKNIKDRVRVKWNENVLLYVEEEKDKINKIINELQNNKTDIVLELDKLKREKLDKRRAEYIKQLQSKVKELNKALISYNKTKDSKYLFIAIAQANIMNIENINLIESLMTRLRRQYGGKDISQMSQDEQQVFAYQVNIIRLLLATFTTIDDIEELYNNNFEELIDNVNKDEINKIINELKEVKQRVDLVKPDYKMLEEQYVQLLLDREELPEHTYKELRDGLGKITARKVLQNMRDINYYMFKLDGVMDSDNLVASIIKKHYTIMLTNTKFDIDNKLRVVNRKIKEFLGNTYKDKKTRVNKFKKIIDNGRLITEHTYDYEEELTKYYDNLTKLKSKYGENSDEYFIALKEYQSYLSNNFEQEYVKEYYDIYNNLSKENKIFLRDIGIRTKELEDRVKRRTNGIFNLSILSEEERVELRDIKNERLQYLETSMGQELKVYYSNLAEYTVPHISPTYKADEAELKNKTKEEKDNWYIKNTDATNKWYKELEKRKRGDNEYKKQVRAIALDLFEQEGLKQNIYGEYNIFDLSNTGLYKLQLITNILNNSTAKFEEHNITPDQITLDSLEYLEKLTTPYTKSKDFNADIAETVPTSYFIDNKPNKNEIGKYYVNGKLLYGLTKYVPVVKDINKGWVKPKSHYLIGIQPKQKYRNNKYNPALKVTQQPKLNKYKNPKYNLLTDEEKEFVQWLSKELNELTSHYKQTIIDNGYIPAKDNNELKAIKDEEMLYKIMTDVTGERKFTIPLSFINKLNQQPLIKYNEKLDYETQQEYEDRVRNEVTKNYDYELNDNNIFDQIEEINNTIRKENKQKHNDSLDYDLLEVLPEFVKSALTHKAKSKLESEVRLSLSILRNAEYQQETSYGKKLMNKLKGKRVNEEDEVVKQRKDSLIYKRLQKDLEMIFYDNFLEPNKYNEVLTKLRNYSSILGIGFNPFSAVKNVAYGTIMTLMEHNAGYFINRQDIQFANRKYMGAMGSFISDGQRDDGTVSSKVNGFITKFDILDAQIEMEQSRKTKATLKGQIVKTVNNTFNNMAYFMQSKGEHLMQNGLLIAMTNSHRIINGKIQSFVEFSKDYESAITKEDIYNSPAEARLKIKEHKLQQSKLKEEFNKYPTVYDSFELKDGILVKKEDIKLNDNELAIFRIKVAGVSHKLHGIYNKEDKGIIENTMIGQLLMQFRHWARPGWVKRFGTRGGFKTEQFWNIRRGEYDEGDYKVFMNFIANPFNKENIDMLLDGKDKNVMTTISAVLKGYGLFFKYAKLHYNTLTTQQQGSIRRTATELATLGIIYILLSLAKGMGDDDDELKRSYFYNFTVYELSAFISELQAYNPVLGGWTNESKKIFRTPAASWGTIERIGKAVYEITAYPFKTPKERIYRSGTYRANKKTGRESVSKAYIKTMQVITGANQYIRWEYLPEQNEYMTFR